MDDNHKQKGKPTKEDYKEKYDSLREHVKSVLRRYKWARKNRMICWMIVCQERGYNVYVSENAAKNAPRHNTVERRLREIQNENGEYQAPKDVQEERQKKEQAMHELFGQDRSNR